MKREEESEKEKYELRRVLFEERTVKKVRAASTQVKESDVSKAKGRR